MKRAEFRYLDLTALARPVLSSWLADNSPDASTVAIARIGFSRLALPVPISDCDLILETSAATLRLK